MIQPILYAYSFHGPPEVSDLFNVSIFIPPLPISSFLKEEALPDKILSNESIMTSQLINE